ncbi:hypothetical protein [Emticicia sp. C21]|uniref:hypothetical protein n=1 Tax=Emticicia sp. C21 TaxID=2302915 RepID=UPI000E344337|nr:hypothetical protein [Emticicia sp. C21]RFS18564.1 hypothetical protein D0T08_04750 [Emticicia sp. C21]
MLKFLMLACVLCVAFGCKREYAHFQKTASENYHQPKKQKIQPLIVHEKEISTLNEIEEIPLLTAPEIENAVVGIGEAIPLGDNQLKEKTDLFPRWLFKKKRRILSNDRKRGIFQKQEKRGIFEKKKKHKRHNGFERAFNERLKIGLVLLGIAIVFALLHINLLAIIFGLLSAFFIIRGLRKLF